MIAFGRVRSRARNASFSSRGCLKVETDTRASFAFRFFRAQLEEAVLRDHLNRGVNEPPGEVHDGA